jgi:hypothetical protein
MKRIICDSAFFKNVLDTARQVSDSIYKNKKWYIEWIHSPYNDINYGDNAWEYYYINPFKKETFTEIGYGYTELKKLDTKNFRETMNLLLKKFIKLNENTKNIINDTVSKLEITNETLGVHIRKTDKHIAFEEPEFSRPLDTEIYIKYIDLHLPKYKNLFIATDDSEELERIKTYVNHKHNKEVKFTDSFRSSGIKAIHKNYPEISGYKKGLDVLLDCYMLSNCGFLIRSTSNVSSTAQFLNLDLKHINVNEIECGDTREHEYNL